MRHIGLVVSYDGTEYSGFQSQPGGRTIQDCLETAIALLTGERVRVTGSGRTDAGVHARAQYVNFSVDTAIPLERWALALNTRLPRDIVVQEAFEVPETFHARRKAAGKTYRYSINCNRIPDLFHRKLEYHHPAPLDIEAMRQGVRHLIGEHDFSAFTSPLSTKPSHVRTIIAASLEAESDRPFAYAAVNDPMKKRDLEFYAGKQRGIYHLYVTGSGFLYNMVRIIAGTLLWVGEGKLGPDDMARILASRDRALAGPTAMPHGLTLWDVVYSPSELPGRVASPPRQI